MAKLGFLILIKVVSAMGRMKPEPPETNFFLMNIPLKSGHQSAVVFFTNSFSSNPEPLCLNNDDPNSSSYALLAHMVCTASKFPTFSNSSLVKPSSVINQHDETSSTLSCHQDDYYEIVCNRSISRPGPCSFLQVTCGSCHTHVQLKPNSSHQLMSPLYPVLQPGLVCQYDLQLPQDISADISIEIADLSLAPAQSSQLGHHCVNSFVHILSGFSFSELKSVATLCGEVFYPGKSSFFKLDNSAVRLQLVGGSDDSALGRRGFIVNVYVSPSRMKIPLYPLVILLSFFGFLIFIAVLLASVILYLNRKSKSKLSHPRRRQTWHGSVPRDGESLHQTRTERIRQLNRLTSTSWGSDNLYMFDNRVSRRLPELPAFNFASDDRNRQKELEDPGFKVYETISLKSKSCSQENVDDETNTEKKSSTSSSHCPPPLPSRTNPTVEDSYSSPLYLTLHGVYSDTDTLSQAGDIGDTTASRGKDQVTECSTGRNGRHGLSVLMDRIRSISATECSEDEAILLDGALVDGEGDRDEVF